MKENIITFNIPNTITVGVMGLIMGSVIALAVKGYQKMQGS